MKITQCQHAVAELIFSKFLIETANYTQLMNVFYEICQNTWRTAASDTLSFIQIKPLPCDVI